MTATCKLVKTCARPVGQIVYTDGSPNGYRDTQMIPAGKTAAEMVAIRFGHCGGLPDGWTVKVVMF